nr:RNA demethylase ALKBH5-like [Ipomoea batatas]
MRDCSLTISELGKVGIHFVVYDFVLTIVLKFFVIQFGDDIPFPSDNEASSSFSEKATVVHAPRIAPTYLNRLKKMIFLCVVAGTGKSQTFTDVI